ncbi:50S ribosomal protein L24 [Ignatzschineria cameli]|uniref:Large ribosomal subunit protein uL24 n=1 Tax=Ignatzschineria cameli TaxID=2182793 RepID=A0A2U2ARW1_9GAMM|nr:50S ribosomal protein L24 [Ignatzschineria cameli]PWD86679.1 50S ribosomal protein L24 [Ignatzschineria cameli]PWD86968.1 50S ribosomal protein L24 [Ignatzschineria cameli]PWD91940.1 50S ribosomal protein L24 [Ignatzschineria cameli]PWD93473.1 50S ribosomal protein L24 [Ignatzschineria cameli]PWD94215.1 50S ribosomal protein L24 [Ignatzschineria cameli]
MSKIRKGDEVVVIAGSSKGHRGSVLEVKDGRVKVAGANKVTKHVRPNPQLGIEGGKVEQESFIDLSNVMIYNPETKKQDKIKIEVTETKDESGKVKFVRERVFKSTNKKVG